MDYPNKTLTKDGAALLAGDDADENNTIIDKMVVSNQLPDDSLELDELTLDNFNDPQYLSIDSYKHQGATFQPEAVFDNSKINLTTKYPVQMIGLLAHEQNDNDNDETLLAVATSDGDPFVMPASTKVPFLFRISLTLTYSNADNVKAVISPAGSVSEDDLDNVLKLYVKKSDVDGELNAYKSSLANSLSTVASGLSSQIASLDSNVGNDVSNQLSKATSELNAIEPKLKMLEGQTPAAPQLSASMDTSNGTITYKITQPAKHDAGEVYQYFVYYKASTDSTYQEAITANNTDTISGLNGKEKYNLYAVAENAAGMSDPSNTVTTDIIDSRVFGATWNRTSDPSMTRTDAAIGLQAGVNGAQNDFDHVGVWSQMKPVYDNNGNKFIRIPKCWIYKNQTGSGDDGQLTIKVSLEPHSDPNWYLPQCFMGSDGTQLPYVDVGAYDASDNGNGGLASQTGAAPLVNTTIDDFRTKARNMGSGYQQLDIHVWDLLQVLFTIEFATLNSQSVMKGCCYNEVSSAENNGMADNGTGSSHTGTNDTMCYRGIENLYGNVFEWIDGVSENGTALYVCNDPSQYQTNVFAYPYQQVGYTLDSAHYSYIKQMGYDPNYPEATLPTDATGNGSSQYFCDGGVVGSSGIPLFFVGSSWDNDDGGGLFCWGCDGVGGTNGDIGGRLIKKAVN